MSDEKEACHLRFKQLFTQADIDNDGVINGRDAAEFFRRLHLPDGFLKKVCVLSDVKRQGSLSEAEFYTSLQLIFLCRLDFASSSDEGYIQDWKEILQLLTQHGVIFPVPPPREKMIKIFEETVVKHGIVTGAQVRAIFGRSSLRQDLFSSLCDMFGMSETKIVDDDLFIRFGLAVQLLLHATAMARRARSNSKAAGSGFSTPGGHGATTPGRTPGSVTPGAQWSRPTAPSGSVTARVAVPSDSLDFVNKKFDDCVRMYFREFFPPGEADPIYRMMEKFGEHFASVNEGLFESDDAPLVLAYAVLMLNTDLHNTAITSKITQDQFIHNLRGCNKGNDISREFLAEIYVRISKNEIKMKDQDEEFRGGRPAGTSWRPAVIKTLTEGAEFKKYGRAGNPHDRWVYVTPDLQHVCYASKFGKASNDQMIPVSNITKLIKGMETPVFERQIDAKEKAKSEKRCFSLDAGARTLDLQAKGEIECKQFYDSYRFLVQGYLTD